MLGTPVGAVCDRPHFVNSRKNARSQTAPTIDTANSADFCHGLLEIDPETPFSANFVIASSLFPTQNFGKRAFPDRSLGSVDSRLLAGEGQMPLAAEMTVRDSLGYSGFMRDRA